MIEPTGYTALDLVGFTDRGTYAANVNYVKNDLVHYGGNIWRILIDDTIGITPAEGPNYTLFIGEPTNLVERIIAPLEDNPATVAYTTGRQIIYNDYLYEVIQNIAVGDILIAYEDDPTNANIKLASPVETQVLALNGRMGTAEADIVALETGKADNSVIAPVESGTTASRAYAAGAHFIKNGAFCTAKTAIAQGEAFTLNTNYTAGTVGQELYKIGEIVNATYPSDRTTRNINTTGGAIVAQLTLTPGKWIMNEGAFISGLTAESSTIHGYVDNANTAITSVATLDNTNGSEMINLRSTGGAIALSGFIEIAQTTTYYYKIYNGNGGYNSGGCKFRAMRIA